MTQPPNYGQPDPRQWQGYGDYAGPYPSTPRRRSKWPWIAGGAVLLLALIGLAGNKSTPTTPSSLPAPTSAAAPAAAASGSTVVYEVTGTGSASVTYSKQGFAQEQQNGAKLPFRKELHFDDTPLGAALTVVAQHTTGGGDLTCRITVDGKVVGEATSSGQYAVVTCNGNG